MPRKYLNHLDLIHQAVGNERRYEMLYDMTDKSTLLPRTVEYKDIDEAFRDWVKSITIIADNGKEYPTMTLFSNQRFTEYSQSWSFTDVNNNILLNFKSITRENNPQYGNIQGGLWNVPGERFYTMKKVKSLDDNGTESIITLKMKEPVAIDLNYKVSVFTTKYADINEFNTKINKFFSARQCYISPNGHFMPMILESISDESQYNIDDRQFYSQSYKIKVMGYVITEDDFRVEESPLKHGINLGLPTATKKKTDVELNEFIFIPVTSETDCGVSVIYVPTETGKKLKKADEIDCTKFFYKPIDITITFPVCSNSAKFFVDTDIVITHIEPVNVSKNYKLKINGEPASLKDKELIFNDGDEIRVSVIKQGGNATARLILKGYNPNVAYESEAEYYNSVAQEEIEEESYDIDGDV